ncbi:MAG: phosphatase PAP2 family protein [Bacteroidia bacterium]|nr:phosphatase PAP2 family protein [Bacteroidia bacterium]MDW8159655.1 phosphatase PAP2 family protein [Bacteroidia bacterium]
MTPEIIQKIDAEIFLFLYHFRHPAITPIFELITNKWIWIPFYLSLCYFFYHLLGIKKTLHHVVWLIILVFLADTTASKVLKPYFERLRPCNEPRLMYQFSMEGRPCSKSFSFVSSHAANSFALATYVTLSFRRSKHIRQKVITTILWSWAFLHTYSRLYLGLHYPLDLVGGSAVGMLYALVIYKLSLWIKI